MLQCGHGSLAVENDTSEGCSVVDEQASMRPRLGSRGEPTSISRHSSSGRASMRPRLGSRGEQHRRYYSQDVL